ncbi:hypothetical protein [Streptomyces sp. NPDC003015]
MRKIQLTYWWNGHEPGDVVDVDDQTARGLLDVIARPAEDSGDSDDSEDGGEGPEPGR